MNNSKHIDPSCCAKCGICCQSFQIGYSKKYDKAMLSEVERFRLLDTDLIQIHEDKTGFWVEFKIPCKHVKKNEQGYYCEIYTAKNRPLLCKQYPHKNTKDCPYMAKPKKVKNSSKKKSSKKK